MRFYFIRNRRQLKLKLVHFSFSFAHFFIIYINIYFNRKSMRIIDIVYFVIICPIIFQNKIFYPRMLRSMSLFGSILRHRVLTVRNLRMAQKGEPVYVAESGAEDAAGTQAAPIKSVLAALIKTSGNVRFQKFSKTRYNFPPNSCLLIIF